MPEHRHEVSLDFIRIELAVEVTFAPDWDVWTRIPYEVKHQDVTLDAPGSASPAEVEAMRKNSGIHHRDDTYVGIADLQLLVAHGLGDLLFEGDRLTLALGFTIPTGQTEHDPFERGDEGKEHLHIQFGRGTVDPLLEVYYGAPLPRDFSLSAFCTGRASVYENGKGYRGPPELSAGLGAGNRVLEWLLVDAELGFYWQGYGEWSGERDINSGLIAFSGRAGLTVVPAEGWSLSASARYPFVTRTIGADSEAFEAGVTLLVTVAATW